MEGMVLYDIVWWVAGCNVHLPIFATNSCCLCAWELDCLSVWVTECLSAKCAHVLLGMRIILGYWWETQIGLDKTHRVSIRRSNRCTIDFFEPDHVPTGRFLMSIGVSREVTAQWGQFPVQQAPIYTKSRKGACNHRLLLDGLGPWTVCLLSLWLFYYVFFLVCATFFKCMRDKSFCSNSSMRIKWTGSHHTKKKPKNLFFVGILIDDQTNFELLPPVTLCIK